MPRAGVEGAISQGANTFDLREARYVGFAKTKLLHLLTGAAMNVARLAAWFAERPRAATRLNKLALLLAPPLTSGALA